MAAAHRDHHLLLEQRHDVRALVRRLAGQAVDRRLQVAGEKCGLQLARIVVDDLQDDVGVALAEAGDQLDELARRDRAHDAELERRLLQVEEVARLALGIERLLQQLLQVRQRDAPQLGQVRVRALAIEQRAAELQLQQLDRLDERGRADAALLGGLGEIQMPRGGQEVADLMHLHGELSLLVRVDRTVSLVPERGGRTRTAALAAG